MVGGGSDAFIGAVHRRAALMENEIELVCGCFSVKPEISISSGRSYYVPDNRIYTTWEEMLEKEAALPEDERMDFVTIVTPNRFHYGPAMRALELGFNVVIDKPMTLSLEEALSLRDKVNETGLTLALTHVYSGYPAVKEAKKRIERGDLGRVRRDSLVQDPFCGSGTLVIEAAQKALNLAPGLRRRFAAEHFDFVPAEVWAEQRQKALADVRRDAAFEGVGYDIDPAAVALANANAKLAGVGDRCRFEVADVKDFHPAQNATVLTNPPYGERLGDSAEAASLARTLGQVWQRNPAQGLYAITADADFEQHFGKKAARRRKIYNGMIPCQLYMYYDQPKAKR